ncbi:S41 family peptidase [Chitinophaga cymbidii]|uniref:Tricorn protease homolog n=1 Tax=Chitinophaga cymbidii TaxID=1096750 RepID=A0A512RR55_9BACT|nr:S41 family peptidase [Chitinophaga cymbidii]GEP98170.1 tricorn protease [Chitinophaga cymbidii]
MINKLLSLSIGAMIAMAPMPALAQTQTKLLRNPAVSERHIAFMYAGDIWIAGRDGSSPTRLTVNPAFEQDPYFSPDGKWIAFTGNYDGNSDVYIIPIEGGDPRRITWHPARELVRGWVDNEHVLFASAAESTTGRTTQLYSVSLKGGLPAVHAKIPEATQGAVSPDGKFTAYIKNPDPTEGTSIYRPFKRYRGGYMPKIWVFNNATHQIEEIPPANSNNIRPVWIGKSVYFLSDRNHTMNIFRYDTDSRQVTQVTKYKDDDVKTLTGDGKTLAFEQGATIHLLDAATGAVKDLSISIRADIPSKRPHYEKISSFERVNISPTGVRMLAQGRGEIFSIPKEKGDVRNISNSPGTHERDPAWSPDGKWISYTSDKDGNYKLILRDQKAMKEPVEIELGKTVYYFSPTWSPDSKKLVYSDAHFNLYYVDVNTKKTVLIDNNKNASIPSGSSNVFSPSWSPDSKWITYLKTSPNEYGAVYLYNLETGKSTPVTDVMSNADDPVFSADGKYIFFPSSTNSGAAISGLHMQTYDRKPTSSIYAVLLSKSTPTIFTPESDEETVKDDAGKKKDTAKSKETPTKDIKVDLDDIQQRIIALPLPADGYRSLNGNVKDKLFYFVDGEIRYYDLKERKAETFTKANGYTISADGKKMIFSSQGGFQIVGTERKPNPGEGKVDISGVSLYVDPVAEWSQIFDEVYKIESDFFYVKNMHGVDWEANKKRYAALLPHVSNRADLNYLLNEMMSEMVVGHNYVGAGDIPAGPNVSGGLLGADFEISNGRYRIKRIYSALSWNPSLKAPLAVPGVEVKEGDYILAVNGTPLTGDMSIFSLLQNQVNRQVVLQVNGTASESGAREIIVEPIDMQKEYELRKINWIEDNRKKVDQLSNGRIAYVYMLNTGFEGYTFFNRYYFAQADKQALLLDERFNGGGSVADYVIDVLNREVLSYWGVRDGRSFTTPGNGIYGPKAMLINEYAGSGGDMMPWMFSQKQLGKLIGKRTMGILVGISGYPSLIDGGYVTSPSFGIYDTKGNWIIENQGTPADIDVEQTPADVIAGRDPQLERGVQVLLEELKTKSHKPVPKPADPVRVK